MFVNFYMLLVRTMDIRYCEAFISAYQPEHQAIFLKAGLEPRGYIPCWKYIKNSGEFNDHVLFNWYEGSLDENIKLIEEGAKLIKQLNIEL